MYEDASIELKAFRALGRIFCILSAGCTAMKLVPNHDVVAVDINRVQLDYARRRFAGGPGRLGAAEQIVKLARRFAPLVGWQTSKVRAFLELNDPKKQLVFWQRHLNTWRFRAAFALIFSKPLLRIGYASPFVELLAPNVGAVIRTRMERCFARHSNRTNPYVHALLLGEMSFDVPPAEAKDIRTVHADAADFLEREPAESYDGFTLSNILDGANAAYRRRLLVAVKHAAAPGAIVVSRSVRDPTSNSSVNYAVEDAAMIWGTVTVEPAATFGRNTD